MQSWAIGLHLSPLCLPSGPGPGRPPRYPHSEGPVCMWLCVPELMLCGLASFQQRGCFGLLFDVQICQLFSFVFQEETKFLPYANICDFKFWKFIYFGGKITAVPPKICGSALPQGPLCCSLCPQGSGWWERKQGTTFFSAFRCATPVPKAVGTRPPAGWNKGLPLLATWGNYFWSKFSALLQFSLYFFRWLLLQLTSWLLMWDPKAESPRQLTSKFLTHRKCEN